jgi:hypothetical protein
MKLSRWRMRLVAGAVATAALVGMPGHAAHAASLWDGLVSYWKLNDAAGASAADSAGTLAGSVSGVVDNGVVNNAPTWLNSGNGGKFNAGLQFDGVSNQHVLVPASTDMNINSNYVTLSAWVKLDQLPSEIAGSFSGIYDSAPDNYVLYLDKGNNELRFKATGANGVSTAAANHPGVRASMLNTSDWLHVMGVYNGDEGNVKIYYNGQLADVTSHTGNANMLGGPVRADQVAGIGAQVAGADPFAPSSLFQGRISDVAVWNRPLGLAEAQYLYNGGTGNAVGAANPNIAPLPPIAPLQPVAQPVVYYKFDNNVANYGTGGSSLDAVVQGPNAAVFAPATFGNGLDLRANPLTDGGGGVASTTNTGTYVSVDYKLTDNGTIAGRFTADQLYNFQTLWANSSHENDWEAWAYVDGRVAGRADRGTPIVAYNIFQTDDPAAPHHYAFSWKREGADVFVQFFVDGELVDQRLGLWRDPGNTFFIGGSTVEGGTASNHYGKGIYDEFRIYSSALTEAEILYLSQNAPETTAPSFAGDFNGDGMVNSNDLNLWKTGFGKTVGAIRGDGDADGNGRVDGADFLIWQREFGSGSATASTGAVPEPAAALLVGVGFAGAAVLRRRRSN